MLSGVRVVEEAGLDYLREKQRPLILFMLGGVDVGKTHTVTVLANRFYDRGLKVAVVDADVGQSDIGPPCCIGMGIRERKVWTLSEVPLHSLYFVGTTSPSGYMQECVKGAETAVQRARKLNADVILVDSTGWIEGDDAKNFKSFEIEAIDPSLVVAIEKEDEVEHILLHLTKRTITLRKSRKARWRTREERKALREEAYDRYFSTAQDRVFDLSLLAGPAEVSQLVSLFGGSVCNRESEEILGLGIIRELDYEREKVVILTPICTETSGFSAVKGITLGGMKLVTVNGRLKEYKMD
jgi:polynucleotide 5'-kinase involved in rRNA processing